MSDYVIGLIITGSFSFASLIVTLLINRRTDKIAKKADKIEKNTDGLVTTLLAGKEETSKAKQDLKKAEGKAEGIAEKQPEIDKLNKDSKPKKKL